ncbi:MAG: hypothetical protein ABIR18_06725 [Chitinophagaceae bacterium]
MNRLLFLLLFLFSSSFLQAQGYLFVKKGYKKKKTYEEGDRILLQVQDGTVYSGLITLLLNDTIYINGKPVPRVDVKAVVLNKRKKKFHLEPKQLLLITAGVALTTAGLTLSEQAKFKEALAAGLTIGYSPLLIQYLGSKISFKRKKFKIGKKFRLQVLDFHMPRKRPF